MNLHEFNNLLIKKSIFVDFKKHKYNTLKSLSLYLTCCNPKIKDHCTQFRQLCNLLLYDFISYNIIERMEQIKNLKKDALSYQALIIRFGIDEGKKRYDQNKIKFAYKNSKQYLIDTYGEEEAERIMKSKCPNNIETLKKKYPDSWEQKMNEYLFNYEYGNSLNGYIEKYGEKDGTIKWNERQIMYTKCNTKEWWIKKYGEEEGNKKWNIKRSNHSYRQSKEYYINTYGKEIGPRLFEENKINSLIKKKLGDDGYKNYLYEHSSRIRGKSTFDAFIEKHGSDEGKKLYDEYIEKQKRAHTLEYYIEKYGENEGLVKFKEYKIKASEHFLHIRKTGKKSYVSKELFDKLYDLIKDKEFVQYFNKDICLSEKHMYDDTINQTFYYDFTYHNKIIEFNGDYWHMNPLKYKADDYNKVLNLTAQEKWNYDKNKTELANKNGYEVLVIWENNFRKNKQKNIDECLIFLYS